MINSLNFLIKNKKSFFKKNRYFIFGIFFFFMQSVAVIRNYADGYPYFFWFCDFVPILFCIGFFIKNKYFIKGLINIGLIPQLIFLLDFVYNFVLGKSLFSITEELFTLSFLVIISTLFIHLSTAFAFLFTYKEESNKKPSFFLLVVLSLYIL